MADPINIIGGFYKDDTLSWACQDTVNYLPTQAEVSGTKTPSMLRTPPGLRPWVNIGDGPNFTIRGMHDAEGRLFVVAGTKLYQISNKGIAIPLGTIPGRGRVSIAHNQIAGGNEILVVNGNSGYVWNTLRQTFTRITDPGYPGAFQAVFADGYLIQAEPFGRYAFHSDLANALEYNTLDRFEAESEPDKIVAVVVSNDEVRVFGERTTQLFANTGAAQGTFQSKGITINRGCAGRWTALAMDNGVFFLGDDGVVYRDNGYNPARISTYAIEQAIADNDWSQAFAFSWSSRGHSVYYLTFPDGQTWGYDVSSGAWHRRASYHPAYEVSRRWRLNDLVYSNGQWIGGDYTSGMLYVLDWDYILEGDDNIVSERTGASQYSSGTPFSVDMVEAIMRTGDRFTSPVSAPDQPEGPTISGKAPIIDQGDPFTYTYTVGAGDSPIVRTYVLTGNLVEGLSFNESNATLSGTPTKSGVMDLVIRTIDQNGKFAEVTDLIYVVDAQCGAATLHPGGESFPTIQMVYVGTDTGLVTLKYATVGNPDKFQVWIDGAKVIDTGYHGDVSFQPQLDLFLESRGLPLETIIQRPGDDATPEEQWSNGNYETATFTKSSSTSIAEVRVFGPLPGTGWLFSLDCPT